MLTLIITHKFKFKPLGCNKNAQKVRFNSHIKGRYLTGKTAFICKCENWFAYKSLNNSDKFFYQKCQQNAGESQKNYVDAEKKQGRIIFVHYTRVSLLLFVFTLVPGIYTLSSYSNPESLYKRGYSYYKNKQYDHAMVLLASCLKVDLIIPT
jgi:TolA-binding protein